MNDRRVFIFNSDTQRRLAKAYCDTLPDGYRCTIEAPKKTRPQEEKYHAMIGDIAKSCKFMGKKWDTESWKRLLIDAFVRAKRLEATCDQRPDPFDGEDLLVPALEGEGVVHLGAQSRRFKKKTAAEFIEYLYAWGTENGAVWNEDYNQPERTET